jgi:hypothetical protein
MTSPNEISAAFAQFQQDGLKKFPGHIFAFGDIADHDHVILLTLSEHQQGTQGVLGFLGEHDTKIAPGCGPI